MRTIKKIVLMGILGLMGLMGEAVQAQCGTVSNILLHELTGTTATIGWVYDSVTSGSVEGFTLILTDTALHNGGIVTAGADERTYTFTGLSERTTYQVRVVGDCSGADTLAFLFTTPCSVGGALAVGNHHIDNSYSATKSSNFVPVRAQRGNSLSQQIYHAVELDGLGTIAGIRFYMYPYSNTLTRQWDVYVDTTSVDWFASTADYIPQDSAHMRFSGPVELRRQTNAAPYYSVTGVFAGLCYVDILFDSVYVLPAGKNLLLTVNDHSGATGATTSFYTHSVGASAAIYGARNGATAAFNPADSLPFASIATSNSGALALRNDVLFLTPACGDTYCKAPIYRGADYSSDATSATLHWSANDCATSWTVKYREADSLEWTVASTYASDTFYTITGLTGGKEYKIRIVSNCDPLMGTAETLHVPCAWQGVPFHEDFETTANESCWYGTLVSFNSITHSNFNGHNFHGTYACGSLSTGKYMVLPHLDVPVDSLAVSFWAACRTSVGRIAVGVCTDPRDESTFTVVDTVVLDAVPFSDWFRYTVFLENYDGPDGYIFLKGAGSSVAFDEVEVDYAPSCPSFVGRCHIDNVTATTASVTFHDRYAHSGWTLLWGTSDTMALDTDSLVTASTTVTLTGLQPNTDYSLWVRAHCDDGTRGHWQWIPHTVHTASSPVGITRDNPWYEDFEGDLLSNYWHLDDTNFVYWDLATAEGLYQGGGNHYGPFSGLYMVSVKEGLDRSGESMLVLPTFDFSALDTLAELSFMHHQSVENDSPTKVYYRLDSVGDWIYITSIDTVDAYRQWISRRVSLPATLGAAFYQVALLSGSSHVALDDLRVGAAVTCTEPTDVQVRDITGRSAVVSWTGNAPAYKVQYRKTNNSGDNQTGREPWTARIVEGVDTMTLVPLEMLEGYEVCVIGLCNDYEESSPSRIVPFTTGFCQNRADNSNFSATDADTVSVLAPAATCYRYSYTEVLVDSAELAGMGTIEAVTLHVNKGGAHGDDPHFIIYMGHTTDTVLTQFHFNSSTFTCCYNSYLTVDSGAQNVLLTEPFEWDGHSNVIVGFYTSLNTYVSPGLDDTAFYAAHTTSRNKMYWCGTTNYSYYWLGNVGNLDTINNLNNTNIIKTASNVVPNLTFTGCTHVCFEPVVSSISPTGTSVTVAWYNEGDPVQVELKEAGETWSDAPVTVSSGNRHTFDWLEESTAYDVRLRRVCDAINGDYSDWVECHISTTPGCHTPGGLAATAVGATTATLSWEGAGTGYEVRVWNGDGVDLYYEAAASPFTADGLRPNASYRAAVRTVCAGNEKSDWSQPLQFDNVCHPATDLTATSHDGNVYLSWTAGEHNQQWIVTWGYAGDERNQRVGFMETDTTAATITGLLPEVSYGFRVVAVCGDGWQGGWTGAEVTATVSTEGIDAVDGSTVYLYPNPATKRVTVGGLEGENTVTVVDMNGRECGKWKVESGEFSIDLSGYARGAYFVRITGERTTSVRKLVVK